VDSDAKKVELYRNWLNIQLLDHLVQNLNLSCNDLASTAIDQEGTMRACEAAEEKKRKRTIPGPTGGSSSGAPPKYRMVYTTRSTAASTSAVLGKPPVVLAAVVVAAAVHPCSVHSAAPGGS
jgi:hypothetical protein